MIKKILPILFLVLSFEINAQQNVSQEEMIAVYNEVKTPHKYGLVMVSEKKSKKIDSPSIFRKGNFWYMTYILFDGRGYETWLAKSKNLLDWITLGKLLSFSDSTDWDNNQKAGYIALQNPKWGGNYTFQSFKGKYWMSYLGGKDRGYESGKLAIGMASTKLSPTVAHEWNRLIKPVLASSDSNVHKWEDIKIYKSSVVWDKDQTIGYPFVMYYNATGDTTQNNPKWGGVERIGMAVSNDMENWKRFGNEPVLHHSRGITGDAVLQKMDNLWIMFYFGAFWKDKKDAFNRFACSYDLVHWTDWNGDDLINPSESYDEVYAHKSYVVKNKGIVYHFYCAVDKKGNRGIAVATSKDIGKSKLQFIESK
jgi:predicted GH43/DUF377 family glycosyl hydrolase